MSAAHTLSVNPLRMVLGRLAARGIPCVELLARHGISPALLDSVEGRIGIDDANRLMIEAAAMAESDDFGLDVAGAGPLGAGPIAVAARSAATVREAFATICRFHRLVTGVGHVELSEERQRARLSWHLDGNEQRLCRHFGELYLGVWVRGLRELTGVDCTPLMVRFCHARPPSVAAHERHFRCEVLFDQPLNEIELERSLLEVKLETFDPTLARIALSYCEDLLARLPAEDDFVMAVRHMVARSLGSDGGMLERLAARFHLTPRTLQRRLSAEGLSLRGLIDDARRETALRHVGGGELAIGEIAELVGFDAPSSFHRAFRRWTGVTPAQYRARERR